jgi:hypothetical protein
MNVLTPGSNKSASRQLKCKRNANYHLLLSVRAQVFCGNGNFSEARIQSLISATPCLKREKYATRDKNPVSQLHAWRKRPFLSLSRCSCVDDGYTVNECA